MLANYLYFLIAYVGFNCSMIVSCFCALYSDIDNESSHILGEKEEDCKFTFLTRLSVYTHTYIYKLMCAYYVYLYPYTH